MLRIDISQYRGVFKMLLYFAVAVTLSRLTSGAFIFVVALIGAAAVTKRQYGLALLCYMFIPFLSQVNSSLIGRGSLFSIAIRISPMILTLFMLLQSFNRKGVVKLPMGMLYAYLVVALVSSINGWLPMISYLKILNFLIFLIGIHVGTMNLDQNPLELQRIRDGLLAFSLFVIVGSVLVIPFPSIGYSMLINNQIGFGATGTDEEILREFTGIKLFSGVITHSQALSPLVVATATFVFWDMLFVVRKVDFLHLATLAMVPILLYMSRSRIGLFGFALAMLIIYVYALPKAQINLRDKAKIRQIFNCMVAVGIVVMAIMEVRQNSFSKWIRKTDDVKADSRELSEAVTASRQGVIAESMRDFSLNPFLGMGFQTCEAHKIFYQMGRINILSAPIEKGLLPVMILGETGILGAFVFFLFILSYVTGCATRKYICALTGMLVLFGLNMAEAVYFSPGGVGSSLWIVLVAGGFTVDMFMRISRRTNLFYNGSVA